MITIAPALLFGAATLVLVREGRTSLVCVWVVFLFGFFVAATPIGHALADALSHWLGGGGGGHPVPSPGPGVTA